MPRSRVVVRNDATQTSVVLQARAAVLLLGLLLWCGTALPSRAQRDLQSIPDPDPNAELALFEVADGFEVNLYASDPDIAKPIQMNFDPQGRLWVASSSVYPQIEPGQEPDDKIVVLEDRDRDGSADHTTVFARGLLIPTGVVPGDGGAYVANSTELLHIADTDGDGRGDRRRVVLSGFGTEDTHHLLHTLRWGPDGALYLNQSIYIHSHVETPYGVKSLNGGGIWRFRPETLELDVFCRGFVNPWGHHFDAYGQSLATDGAYREGINYVFPGAVFFSAPGATRIVRGLNPGSPKHCGLDILSGRHLPEAWRGTMVTNDFRAHRVCRFRVTEAAGSGYASRQEAEVLKTSHVAFRPVDVKMGPDGAIYIADWYSPIIQHGEVDFRDPRRDHVHGRIWRITCRDRETLAYPRLIDATVHDLFRALEVPEQWTREQARLVLRSRSAEEVMSGMRGWLASLDPQGADYDRLRLEALWVSQAVRRVDRPLLQALLDSPDHRVRAAAMRVVATEHDHLSESFEALRRGVDDRHPRVRLEAVRGLAAEGTADAATLALRVVDAPRDEYLDFAIWQTVRDLRDAWVPALSRGDWNAGGNVDRLAYALRAADSPDAVAPLLELLDATTLSDEQSLTLVETACLVGSPEQVSELARLFLLGRRGPEFPERVDWLRTMLQATERRRIEVDVAPEVMRTAWDSHPEPPWRALLLRALGSWKLVQLEELAQSAAVMDGDRALREAAWTALARLDTPTARRTLVRAAGSTAPVQDRAPAIAALAGIAPVDAAGPAAEALAQWSSDRRPAVLLDPFLQRQDGLEPLVAALGSVSLNADIARQAVAHARSSGRPVDPLVQVLQQSGRLDETAWEFDAELVAALVEEAGIEGDARQGERVYRRASLQCIQCHAIGGAGGRVGPDLISIGASAPVDYLIEALLAPNAKVKENFHAQTVVDTDGRIHTGIPVQEGDGELVLRDAQDQLVRIPLEAIDERLEARSLMPEGTVNELTRQELVDLVRFLSELGKADAFSIGTEPVARSWEFMIWTAEAHRRLNRTSFDAAAGTDPVFQWQPVTSTVAGDLPLEELPTLKPHDETPPTTFLRCRLEVTHAGPVALALSDPKGVELWVDGRPTPTASAMTVELERGIHTVTLAVNRDERESSLRLELDPNASGARWLLSE